MKHLTAEEADLYYTTSFTTTKDNSEFIQARSSSTSPRTYTAKVSLHNVNLFDSPPKPMLELERPPNSSGKQVRFGKIHKRTYQERTKSKSERKNLWYSGRDIRDMRTEICALNMSVAAMAPDKRSLLIEAYESKESWRGLEHVKDGTLIQKVEHRRDFSQAFLYFSKELGISDPEALAVFSATNSKEDRARAVELAKQDATEACQIYYSLLTLIDSSSVVNNQHTCTPNTETPPRRVRRQSKGTPRHHSENKQALQPQVLNLTRSL